MQHISVEGLPLEKQFALNSAFQNVDAIQDIKVLKDLMKDIMRLSLLNEEAHNDLKKMALEMHESWYQRNEGLIAVIIRLEEMIKCLVLKS